MTVQYNLVPNIAKKIFRAYDIRGITGSPLSADAMYTIGLSFGSLLHENQQDTVYVGRDGRLTSAEFSQALIKGIMATGCHVIDIGCVPTPMLYYACKCGSTTSGVIVTASHNPAAFNGLKMVVAGKTLSELAIQALYERIIAQRFQYGQGTYRQENINEGYYAACLSSVQLARPLKVVVDAGNGVAGPHIVILLERFGCEVIPLYCDVDGHFPHHHPDPSELANMQDLIATVKAQQADVGVALDGDADRLGVVTNDGEVIWADRLIMLFVKHLLQAEPGAEIIYDVKCSRNLATLIRAAGGVPTMYRTGHSLIKAKLQQSGAKFAGEMSGHLFFADRWYGFDDGMYACLRLLEILAQDQRSCATIFAEDIPQAVATPEIKIPIAEHDKFTFMQAFIAQAEFNSSGEMTDIDGLRVDFPHGWGLVRASNTSPNLIARFEAEKAEDLQMIQADFRQQLLAVNAELAVPF